MHGTPTKSNTRRSRKRTSKQQAEGIPCVLVIELAPDLSGRFGSYALKNVGSGIALNIRGSLPSWKRMNLFKHSHREKARERS
jgi:hypothetical protein